MTTGGNGLDCVELYRASLDGRLQQGDWDLVCKDEELFRKIEECLSKSNGRDVHSQLGLDTLSVIEESLQAPPTVPGQTRLGRLAKAFEVLELAALNLYLCPWRKEFRVVKTFSGMFTHCVKPALTSQQARKLFGLLGYRPAGVGEEEELRLHSEPANAAALLRLVCAFFTARVECQLLLSTAEQLGGQVEHELLLVQERKRGHSLRSALESTRRKLGSVPPSLQSNSTETGIDLYTDNTLAKGDHMTSPPSCSYVPPNKSILAQAKLGDHDSQSPFERETLLSAVGGHQGNGSIVGGFCSSSSDSGSRSLQPFPSHIPSYERPPCDSLEQHVCMIGSTNDYFYVCHDCCNLHEVTCKDLLNCEARDHNVQITGRLQPPQEAQVERHTCLRFEDPSSVVCNTCSKLHDLLCDEKQRCQVAGHDVKYLMDSNKEETLAPSMVMAFHHCCTSKMPTSVCLTCKILHATSCSDSQCQSHARETLSPVCSECQSCDIHQLCRCCLKQYCKSCWYKSPLHCRCGTPFQKGSPV